MAPRSSTLVRLPRVELDEPMPALFDVLCDGKSGELPAAFAMNCEVRAPKWEGGVSEPAQL